MLTDYVGMGGLVSGFVVLWGSVLSGLVAVGLSFVVVRVFWLRAKTIAENVDETYVSVAGPGGVVQYTEVQYTEAVESGAWSDDEYFDEEAAEDHRDTDGFDERAEQVAVLLDYVAEHASAGSNRLDYERAQEHYEEARKVREEADMQAAMGYSPQVLDHNAEWHLQAANRSIGRCMGKSLVDESTALKTPFPENRDADDILREREDDRQKGYV